MASDRKIAWQHPTGELVDTHYKTALNERSYDVSIHHTAAEFLDALSRNKYDLLVSYCMIGSGMDEENRYPRLKEVPNQTVCNHGHGTAAESIRYAREIAGPQVPIVIMSGCRDREIFLAAGANHFIDIIDMTPNEFANFVSRILSPQALSQ
jgi:hypothetical protein